MKQSAKKILSNNAKEMKRTGGGSAKIMVQDGGFEFSQVQVSGHSNEFDDDHVADYTEVEYLDPTQQNQSFVTEHDSMVSVADNLMETDETNLPGPVSETPKYMSKKMKLSSGQSNMIELKTISLNLDIELKQLDIEQKTKNMKHDIEIKQLDLMIKRGQNYNLQIDTEYKKLLIRKLQNELESIDMDN
jgi:hypothetical protein